MVLFDEIEKAHPEVLNVLLQLLDDGRLTDGKGRTVDFKNAVVIMTSNLGSQFIAEASSVTQPSEELPEGVRRQVTEALRQHFRPEFLNRIDEIIFFHALGLEHMKQIIDIQVRGLLKRLEERKIHVELTDAAKRFVVSEGYDPMYGARPLKRTIQRRVLDPLAMRVLQGEFREGDRVIVDVGDNGLRFEKTAASGGVEHGEPPNPSGLESARQAARRAAHARIRRPSGRTDLVRARRPAAAGARADVVPVAGRPADLRTAISSRRSAPGASPKSPSASRRSSGPTRPRSTAARTSPTTRIEDPKLLEELDAAGVKYTGEFVSRWLPEVLGWVLPLLFIFAIWSYFSRRMGGAEGGVMSFARSKHRVFAEDDVKVSFADVAGVDEAEQELKEIVEFLKNPKKYTALGGRIPKGVLLVGPPGTGKTLLARAVAGEAKVPFFSLSGSEFVEMFVGVGAARVRDLFSQAEQKAPCIIFIDELDALGRARVQSPMGSHEEREQTLNQLLAEMDGFDSRKAIIIMAATNRPEVLDPALLRPGRFDRQVLVDKPDVKGREEILTIHTKNVKLSPQVDLARHRGPHGRICRRRPRQPGERGGAAGGAQGQDRRRHVGLRRGDRSPDRRPREEARDEPAGARDRRVSRVRPRDRRDVDPGHGSRSTRSRSCSAGSARSATRCSCRSRIAT